MLGRLELDPKLRELAILQVAASTEGRYEWVQHVEISRAVGVTDAQIAAVELGEFEALDEVERAVVAFASEIVAMPRGRDGTFDAVRCHLTPGRSRN